MRPRAVLAQLAVFAVISALVIWYALFEVIGLSFTDNGYPVTVRLSSAGGVFAGSDVTYRGVMVGKVTDVELHPNEVIARLDINDGTRIPSDSIATVTNLSPIGEQYLDFSSRTGRGPYLHDGSVVQPARTRTPVETATVLFDLQRLVRSLDPADIGTLSDELAAAFAGTGPQLRQILASASTLTGVLDDSRASLTRLLRNGGTLLRTASRHTGDLATFTRTLAQLSRTIAGSTPALEKLLAQAPGAVGLFDQVLQDNADASAVILGNLVTFSQIQVAQIPGWKALLVAVPEFERAAPTIISDGRIRAWGVINYHQKLCNYGVPLTSPISGTKTPIKAVQCAKTPAGTLQRGANYAPGAGVGTTSAVAPLGVSARPTPSGSAQVASYVPGSDVVVDSTGRSVRLGWNGGQRDAFGSMSWQTLLLSLVGVQ